MKFTVAGSAIICSRRDQSAPGEDGYRRVVEFDAHVDSIPPHVASRLTGREIAELEAFLEDHRRIRANPAVKNMLEALPGLLAEATETLEKAEQLNESMYEELTGAIAALKEALNQARPEPHDEPTPVRNMRQSEAQKARLDSVKKAL